jgi:hypothetical protein
MADLAVRVARAEMERDAALEREAKARNAEKFAWRAYASVMSRDSEKMLDSIRIMDIPARDIKAICEIVTIWQQQGGNQEMLKWWNSAVMLRVKEAGT